MKHPTVLPSSAKSTEVQNYAIAEKNEQVTNRHKNRHQG